MNQDLKVSVIIATYNAESALRKTLSNLKKNKYSPIEIIVIDGGSKDNTTQLLRSENSLITKWISEPDKGIYDAWNKGLKFATGSWITFLGAGDFYLESAIEDYIQLISQLKETPDFVSSKIQLIDEQDNRLKVVGVPWVWKEFKKAMRVAHVGAFHNRQLFTKYGNFDPNLKIVGDYELLARPRHELKTAFLDKVTASMLIGGVSTNSNALSELNKVKIKNGIRNPIMSNLDHLIAISKFTLRRVFR